MPFELKYGDEGSLQLELPQKAVVADGCQPRGTPLDDPASAVIAALADPLDFPPFSRAVIPGDRIALALDLGIPLVGDIVAGAVHTVLEAGASAEDIAVVLAPGSDPDSLQLIRSRLPLPIRDQVGVVVHDPTDEGFLGYLAASKDGKPVYFNRWVYDADVVLPISTMRLEKSLGYVGVHGGLFPTFSDGATLARFRAPTSADWAVHQRRRREEADEAAWLLGVQCTLQIAPGPGNSVLHALAGDARAVAQKGRVLCEAAWLHQAPQRASLVVATIEGGPEQQTWENFARALFAASHAVTDGGAIVLCTNLCRAPGPALRRLTEIGATDDEVQRDLRREKSVDAMSAALLAEAQQRAQVYLLSGLDGDVVEDLGLGHVTDVEQVQRLSRGHRSCILLGNAHHAMLATNEDP